MPNIVRQQPRPVTRRQPSPSRNGSLLSQAVPVSQITDDFIHMVLYGQNRVGKTTLACQWPKPLLLVAMEPNKTGGAQSVKKVPGVTYLRIDSSADAILLAEELRSDSTYKSIVIDGATSLQDIILKELLNLPKVPEMLSWGMVSEDQYRQRSEKCREVLRCYTNLEKHLIIIAKEKDHNKQIGERRNKLVPSASIEAFFAADLGSATVGWLHDCCDYIGRLSVDKETKTRTVKSKVGPKEIVRTETYETGHSIRRLRTMLHPNYAAGFRSSSPEKVPEFIDNPTFEKIKKVIDGIGLSPNE